MSKKIAVIGFGAAAIGFLWQFMDNEDYEIDVYEKAGNVMSSSLSGIRSDGKFIVSEEMGSDIYIPMSIQREALEIYKNSEYFVYDDVYMGFGNKEDYLMFYNAGFQPIRSEVIHIGTDQLKNVIPQIFEKIHEAKNIKFHFNEHIKEIKEGKTIHIFGYADRLYDYIVVAVGRSGYKLVDDIIKENDGLRHENEKQIVDIGVRFEMPDILVEDLNKRNYEWKVKKTNNQTGHGIRTFCYNPQGQVVSEIHNGFKTVNGHTYNDNSKKSNNTNFAILVSAEFTYPFQNPNQFGENIALISNQLAGGNKIMLQKLGDFLEYKRTKRIGRVKPTLPENEYTLCNINLAMPSQIRQSLVGFIEELGNVVPGIIQEDNLLYFSEVKFYGNKTQNKDGIYFIGDCSGNTRSIVHASSHGIMMAREILNSSIKNA